MIHALVVALLLLLVVVPMTGCAPATSSIRVMSFNVRLGDAADGENAWPNRKLLLLKTIQGYEPDLLGTQEVLAYQADFLRENLKGYRFVGVGRDDGQRAGEFCAIWFREDRFDALDSGHFWLSESPDKPGSKSWDTAITRMVSWVKLRDRASRPPREFVLLNTHFDHIGKVAQQESAKLIVESIARLSGNERIPVIVTGDLNCAEDDPPLRVFFSASLIDSFRDAHPHRSPDEATFHAFKGTTRGKRIDFILHSADVETIDATIVRTSAHGRYPSDHFPVTAALQWRSAK